ncbi:hypothetical protein GCM10010441_52290 [Kitasatospora paracochleata]|uniref:Uncharacterized protein n=1 Tax=Kitasatospora paracochleata TaxID=58354 RepID=A0ABT1JB20_9ACTN|nr:hypothetical protein [Kitasatospora paracochleata]
MVPWLETFCEPIATAAGGDLGFWVRDASLLNGPSAAKGQAAGFGTYDHSNQTLAAGIPTGCAPGDIVIAAIGSNTGSAPVLPPGWQRTPEVQLSSYRLTIAFRRATDHDGCTLSGTSQAQWETALVSLGTDGPSPNR